MTFKLILVFSGLVTFVPVMDPQHPNSLLEMWVLMVNADDDTDAICKVDDQSPHHLAQHIPRMVFDARYKDPTLPSSGPSIDFTVSLEDTDVRLDATGGLPNQCLGAADQGDIRRSLGQRISGTNMPGPGACEARDLTWVADLGQFAGGFANVCRHCLDDLKKPGDSLKDVPADRVKARIKLTRGFLDTAAITKTSGLDFVIFAAGPSYKQVLAEEVNLTLLNVQDHVTFELCDFLLDPKCESPFPLTLRPTQQNDTVTVRFCNEVTGACPGQGPPSDPRNDHFLFYYKLSEKTTLPGDPDTPCDRDIVIPRPTNGEFGDPRCPHSQMLPPL
jgi:hypothetical protein